MRLCIFMTFQRISSQTHKRSLQLRDSPMTPFQILVFKEDYQIQLDPTNKNSCNKNIDETQITHFTLFRTNRKKTKISYTYQVTMNFTQDIYWSRFMCQKYYWRTLTEELLLFSPCELWISFT